MYPDTLLHIDGKWRPATSGRTIPIINPATEETIGTVVHADVADLDEALAAAARGFEIWKNTPAHERCAIMRRAAALVRERAPAIGRTMTLEQGKPLPESTFEAIAAADTIEWFAEEAKRLYGRLIPARMPGVVQSVVREPIGPVAAFTPWNFPLNQVVRKLSAALATGCSIIAKAPEETPASPAALIQAFIDAGVPAGVIGLVYGNPAEISDYLIRHPVIAKISFTGSTAVGKELAALAGRHMKRATMELGGHAPAIVFDDADVDAAAAILGGSKFRNAGQVCVSPTRFLVQRGVYDRFAEKLVAVAKAVKVGDGLAEGTTMGPLANERRIPVIEAMVQDAVERGARLATGGNRIGNRGYFYEPTVLLDVPIDARAMNEEPFGPLALLSSFETFEDAVAEANRLPYGLASYAYTGSGSTAERLANRIQAGMLTVNHNGLALPEVPFGGVKDSGYGSEGGTEALEPYLNTKFVTRRF